MNSELTTYISLLSKLYEQCDGDVTKVILKIQKNTTLSDKSLAKQALDILQARKRAEERGLGEWVHSGLFTGPILQQSTHPKIAAHHASRFKGCKNILEVCGGLGFDTAALARVSERVTVIEADPVIASYAQHNLSLQGILNVEFIVGRFEEVISSLDMKQFDGVWCDPARRDSKGERKRDVDQYLPPLSSIMDLPITGPYGIKISPLIEAEEFVGQFSREWIGFERECKEQILWKNISITDNAVPIVDDGASWESSSPQDLPEIFELPEDKNLEGYCLLEPHAALIASRKTNEFFTEKDLSVLDYHIAYGISQESFEPSALYTRHELIEWFPFSIKTLRSKAETLKWDARSVIKKRGIEEDPDVVWRALKLPKYSAHDTVAGVVFLTTINKRPIAIIGHGR